MQIHVLSYKKKGAMCSLNVTVVTFGAERETWGRLFQTEMVLGHTEHQDYGVISSLVLHCDVLLQLFPILQSQQPPKIIKYLYK